MSDAREEEFKRLGIGFDADPVDVYCVTGDCGPELTKGFFCTEAKAKAHHRSYHRDIDWEVYLAAFRAWMANNADRVPEGGLQPMPYPQEPMEGIPMRQVHLCNLSRSHAAYADLRCSHVTPGYFNAYDHIQMAHGIDAMSWSRESVYRLVMGQRSRNRMGNFQWVWVKSSLDDVQDSQTADAAASAAPAAGTQGDETSDDDDATQEDSQLLDDMSDDDAAAGAVLPATVGEDPTLAFVSEIEQAENAGEKEANADEVTGVEEEDKDESEEEEGQGKDGEEGVADAVTLDEDTADAIHSDAIPVEHGQEGEVETPPFDSHSDAARDIEDADTVAEGSGEDEDEIMEEVGDVNEAEDDGREPVEEAEEAEVEAEEPEGENEAEEEDEAKSVDAEEEEEPSPPRTRRGRPRGKANLTKEVRRLTTLLQASKHKAERERLAARRALAQSRASQANMTKLQESVESTKQALDAALAREQVHLARIEELEAKLGLAGDEEVEAVGERSAGDILLPSSQAEELSLDGMAEDEEPLTQPASPRKKPKGKKSRMSVRELLGKRKRTQASIADYAEPLSQVPETQEPATQAGSAVAEEEVQAIEEPPAKRIKIGIGSLVGARLLQRARRKRAA